MLTGVRIAFLGGDARQLEVIRKCVELDASVFLIGYDNLEGSVPGSTKVEWQTDTLRDFDVIVLPVSGADERGQVESIFSSKPLFLTEEHLSCVKKNSTIYSGIATGFLRNLCDKYRIRLVPLMERDDVSIYNSIPTAEGAVMLIIQNTDYTIHGSTCVVLGLGRTGMTVARTLHNLGARVKAVVRKPADMARAFEMGLIPVHVRDLKYQVADADILVNTVPHKVITAEVIANLKPTSLIIDLASKPGGTDFRFAEKRGIKAILAPGLPGIVAPRTAGRILAHILTRLLLEEKGNREEQA